MKDAMSATGPGVSSPLEDAAEEAVPIGMEQARLGIDGAMHPGIELAQDFWEMAPTLSWVTDERGNFHHFSEADPQCRGVHVTQGPSVSSHWSADIARRFNGHEHAALASPFPAQTLTALQSPEGAMHYFLVLQFPFRGGDQTRCLGGVAIDITQHKQWVDELAHLAVVDELTGLFNRRGFFLFGEHELRVARRRRTQLALVCVDIDGLKEVNDTRGHAEGNALLIETAALLRRVFRECDVIARLGGDEFSILASDVKGDPESLRRRLCDALLHAHGSSGRPRRLSVSVGVSSCGPGDGVKLADMMAAADRAMYREKNGKTGRAPAGSARGAA